MKKAVLKAMDVAMYVVAGITAIWGLKEAPPHLVNNVLLLVTAVLVGFALFLWLLKLLIRAENKNGRRE